MPYRPDLNGIEAFWATAKSRYRSRLDNYKANGLTWDQMTEVKEVIASIPNKTAMKQAAAGWDRLFAAKAIQPVELERIPIVRDPLPPQPPRNLYNPRPRQDPGESDEDEEVQDSIDSYDLD